MVLNHPFYFEEKLNSEDLDYSIFFSFFFFFS